MTKSTLLILVLSSAAAMAQDPSPPPLVSPEPAAPACKTYADCPSGLMCFAGACEPSCSTSADCGQGLHCVGRREVEPGKWTRGVCRGGEDGATCNGPRDCGSGLACSGRRQLADRSGFESFCQDQDLRGPNPGTGAERVRFKGGEVPEGFHVVTEFSGPLIGGGAGAFMGGYLAATFLGLASNTPLAAIPVLGPFFQAGGWWSTGTLAAIPNFFTVVLCGVEFLAQAAGIVMISFGVASPNKWLERNAAPRPVVLFAPGAAGTPLGASVFGRF